MTLKSLWPLLLLLASAVVRLGGWPAAADPAPTPPPGYTRLIFDDEFSGRHLDRSKWQANWLAASPTVITGPGTADTYNCYDPANATVAHGVLTLTAIAQPCHVDGDTYPYRSALIETNHRFNFTHGYIEARMRLPAGTGMWPAFWADGENWPYDGEIDVMEDDGTDSPTLHYHHAGGVYAGSATVPGATSGWHTYAASWDARRITWFYDGRQVGQTRSVSNSPMYLIINLGTTSSRAAVPNHLRVDWVRVWQ